MNLVSRESSESLYLVLVGAYLPLTGLAAEALINSTRIRFPLQSQHDSSLSGPPDSFLEKELGTASQRQTSECVMELQSQTFE